MKLARVHRTPPDPDEAPVTPAARSALGLDDWHGTWPVDDTPAPEGPQGEVPLFLNPGSPNIAPS
jgi:hypothetical protein